MPVCQSPFCPDRRHIPPCRGGLKKAGRKSILNGYLTRVRKKTANGTGPEQDLPAGLSHKSGTRQELGKHRHGKGEADETLFGRHGGAGADHVQIAALFRRAPEESGRAAAGLHLRTDRKAKACHRPPPMSLCLGSHPPILRRSPLPAPHRRSRSRPVRLRRPRRPRPLPRPRRRSPPSRRGPRRSGSPSRKGIP